MIFSVQITLRHQDLFKEFKSKNAVQKRIPPKVKMFREPYNCILRKYFSIRRKNKTFFHLLLRKNSIDIFTSVES